MMSARAMITESEGKDRAIRKNQQRITELESRIESQDEQLRCLTEQAARATELSIALDEKNRVRIDELKMCSETKDQQIFKHLADIAELSSSLESKEEAFAGMAAQIQELKALVKAKDTHIQSVAARSKELIQGLEANLYAELEKCSRRLREVHSDGTSIEANQDVVGEVQDLSCGLLVEGGSEHPGHAKSRRPRQGVKTSVFFFLVKTQTLPLVNRRWWKMRTSLVKTQTLSPVNRRWWKIRASLVKVKIVPLDCRTVMSRPVRTMQSYLQKLNLWKIGGRSTHTCGAHTENFCSCVVPMGMCLWMNPRYMRFAVLNSFRGSPTTRSP